MRSLICAFVVRIWHKTHFLMARLIYVNEANSNRCRYSFSLAVKISFKIRQKLSETGFMTIPHRFSDIAYSVRYLWSRVVIYSDMNVSRLDKINEESKEWAYTSYSRSRNSRFGIPYPLLAYIAYPTTHFTQAYDTSMISAEMAVNGSLYSR